jgi:hypothetical protein
MSGGESGIDELPDDSLSTSSKFETRPLALACPL